MRNLSRNETVGLLTLLTILTAIVGLSVARLALSSASSSGITLRDTFPQAPAAPPPVRPTNTSPVVTKNAPSVPTQDAPEVVVHVVGAVNKPGVYHLPVGARGEDALKAAGGPTANADPDAVNLAARVEDGSQLVIPKRGEAVLPPVATVVPSAVLPPASVRKSGAKPRAHSGGRSLKLTDPSQGQVNLNTANAAELQRIPGVGPTMAARILEFRQTSGGFKSVEDMLQVSGIGDKKFEKMRPFVKVN